MAASCGGISLVQASPVVVVGGGRWQTIGYHNQCLDQCVYVLANRKIIQKYIWTRCNVVPDGINEE